VESASNANPEFEEVTLLHPIIPGATFLYGRFFVVPAIHRCGSFASFCGCGGISGKIFR
jgi:hypothetical protein